MTLEIISNLRDSKHWIVKLGSVVYCQEVDPKNAGGVRVSSRQGQQDAGLPGCRECSPGAGGVYGLSTCRGHRDVLCTARRWHSDWISTERCESDVYSSLTRYRDTDLAVALQLFLCPT